MITTTCSPTGNGTIAIFVTIPPAEGPLKIIGIRLPDKVGDPPRVVLQNTSDKTVQDFNITALIGSPRPTQAGVDPIAGIESSSPHPIQLQWIGERLIPPGEMREVHESALRSHDLATMTAHLHLDCAHVAVFLNRVDFADGTVWTSDRSSVQEQKIWRDSFRPKSTSSCENPPMAEGAVGEVKGFGYTAGMGSTSHGDTEIVSHYAFSCPVHVVGGQLVALCAR